MSSRESNQRFALMLCTSAWLIGAGVWQTQARPVPENPGIGALVAGFAESQGETAADGSEGSKRREATTFHRHAVAAEEGAAHRAVTLFEDLVAGAPNDPLLSAYLGSSMIMKGRDQTFLPARLVSIHHGRARLDAAVAAAPHDFDIRLLRVASTMNLPDFVRNIDAIRDDLGVLLGATDAGARARRAEGDMEARLRLVLAWACLKLDDKACARDNLATLSRGSQLGLAGPVAILNEALAQ